MKALGKGPDDIDGWAEYRPHVALEFATNAIRGLPTTPKGIAEQLGIDEWLAKIILKELSITGDATETLKTQCPTCGEWLPPPDMDDLFLECWHCESGQYILTEEILAEYTAPPELI